MKKFKFILPVLMLGLVYVGVTSCRKKETGNCYCKYVGGDRTHYDLTMLERSQQGDSCAKLDKNAGAFGGSCKLK